MKNLETEYRKAFTEEMPDLWGRIENNLTPKKVPVQKRRLAMYRYGGLVAAALFLAIIIPGSLSLMNQNNKSADMLKNEFVSLKSNETKQLPEAGADGEREEACDTVAEDSAFVHNSVKEENREEIAAIQENYAEAVTDGTSGTTVFKETKGYYTILEYWEADGGRIYALKQNNITVTALLSKESMKEMESKDFSLEAGEEYLFTLEDSFSEDFTYRIISVK